MKRLQQKIDVYLERDIIHVPSSSYKIVKKEDEDIKVKIIEDFDDLKKMLDDDSISGDVKCFFLNETSCFSLWRELYLQMKYEASFKMFNDKLDFSMLRISNINGKNIQVYTYEEDGVFLPHFCHIVHHFEPEARTKKISPNCMYIIIHNNHVYHINHNLKRLQQKIDVYLERDIIHVPSSSYKIAKKEDEDMKVKIIEDFDDLKKMLDDDSISGDVKCFFLT